MCAVQVRVTGTGSASVQQKIVAIAGAGIRTIETGTNNELCVSARVRDCIETLLVKYWKLEVM